MGAARLPPAFRRASVADQVEAALVAAIAAHTWDGALPGGHELARRLGTSRDSVRTALARLAKVGVVTLRKGRCAELKRAPRSGVRPSSVRTVCVIAPMERRLLDHIRATSSLPGVQAAMVERDMVWEEVFDASLAGSRPEAALRRVVASRPGACWVLIMATAAMQRWFEASRLPAMILGTCHEGVTLPSVDLDYRAIGWHAAGQIRRLGHREIALVAPDPALGGDLACRNGFGDYLARASNEIRWVEVAPGPTSATLAAALDRRFAHAPRPTAIFAMKSAHALTVFSHLLLRGHRIPEDVSVVSRDNHSLFDVGLPRLARYGGLASREAACAVRIVQALLAPRPVVRRPIALMPSFIAGETLGRSAGR